MQQIHHHSIAEISQATPPLVIPQGGIQNHGQDTCQSQHKGIYHAHDQAHCHHIALEDVRHFMAGNRRQFFLAQGMDNTFGEGDQCLILGGPRSESIGRRRFEYPHFRHLNFVVLSHLANYIEDEKLSGVCRSGVDKPHSISSFGDGFAEPKRNK